jgi:hypothetical protein
MSTATPNTAAKAAEVTASAPMISIDRIAKETLLVPVIGTSPLICHNFSSKSKAQMLDAQQGRKKIKQVRDPEAEYEASFYRIVQDDGEVRFGMPVVAFKAATTSAARYYDKSVSMTALRQLLFFRGVYTPGDPQQLVEIVGEPRMREDIVRLGGVSRSADLRYRAEFSEWSATLQITYVTSSISRQSVLSLVDAGGLGVGVGEWRPERRGEFGTFMVDPRVEVSILPEDQS